MSGLVLLVASPEAVASVRSLTADIEEFTASSARLNTEIKNLEAERTPHTKMRTRQIEGGRTSGLLLRHSEPTSSSLASLHWVSC